MNNKERLTEHHLTPRCIAKVWGWSKKQINHPMNREMLPHHVHQRQDEVIPILLHRAIEQATGKRTVKLWDHHNEMIIFERARLARDIAGIFAKVEV